METRITCELKDVKAIEFECTECHAKTAIPVDHFKNPPTRCTLCEAGGQWLMAGGQEWNDLVGLSKALQRLSDTGTGKFLVRLEIANAAH